MDGMILSFIKNAYEYIGGPEVLVQPIWGCVKCMASVWGIVFLLIIGAENATGHPFLSLVTPVYIFALCGLNMLSSELI